MPINKQKVEVIKVQTERPICRPKRFPRMPIMYLELIENKDKIKQDLINKEYIPSSPLADVNEQDNKIVEDYKTQEIAPEDIMAEDEQKEIKTSHDTPERQGERSDNETQDRSSYPSPPRNRKEMDSDSSAEGGENSDSEEENNSKSASYSDSEEEDDNDIISKKIKKLLHEERSKSRSVESYGKITPPPQSSSPPNKKDGSDAANANQPPTLSELKNKGQYVERSTFRNILAPTVNEQEEEDLKRELLFKFELLKKSYKTANIPEFTIHSDYNTMLKSYNTCLKQVTLDNTVENYKQYLLGGFMLVEFVGSSFLKLDMTGFTQQQMVSMNSYERLLIELGEKSYVPDAKNWPVELRLLFMILMNAGIFVVTKMIMKKTGSNLMNLFGGGGVSTHTAPPPPQRKRRMNGPDINVDDLPDNK